MVPHVVGLTLKKQNPSWITPECHPRAVCCQTRSCSSQALEWLWKLAWHLQLALWILMVMVMCLVECHWQVEPEVDGGLLHPNWAWGHVSGCALSFCASHYVSDDASSLLAYAWNVTASSWQPKWYLQ